MKIKTFRAKSMREALIIVKDEMGPDAILLDTRNVKVGGIFGFFSKKMVEIVAGIDDLEIDESKNISKKQSYGNSKKSYDFPQYKPLYYKPIFKSTKLQEMYDILIKNQIKEAQAADIMGRIERTLSEKDFEDDYTIYEKLSKELEDMIKFSGPIESDYKGKALFFIGPTGVGKTTTIAKIAAKFSLDEKKKVALVSIDTFRIAAVEQLRTYADILSLPFNVVFTPMEMERIVNFYSDFDLILIDTAGRSPKNELRMSELKGFVSKIKNREVHLVLSVTTRILDLLGIVEKFYPLGIDRIIFTKLDESSMYLGSILDLDEKYNIPISYITFGQNVPDDIMVASVEEILSWSLRGYYERSSREVKANSL